MRMMSALYVDDDRSVRVSAWMAPGSSVIHYRFGSVDPRDGQLYWCDVETWRAVAPDVLSNMRHDWVMASGRIVYAHGM